MSQTVSRRTFLKGSLAATGLSLGVSVTPLGSTLLNAAEKQAGFKPSAWFEITPDNRITVVVSSSEMGQGIRTALSMILADELEADWKQLQIVQSGVDDAYKNPVMNAQITVGSISVRGYYEPLRKAGAAGRMMLVRAAAERWKVPEAECTAVLGTVRHDKTKRSLKYGQLCLDAAKLPVPNEPLLKKESEFRYIGKNMPRVDIPDKVAGKAIFGIDVNVPDMLVGVIARPPAYGAKAVGQNNAAAQAVKGVRTVATTPNGIAVVADSITAALKGREALAVKWDKGSHPDMNTASVEKSFFDGLDKPGAVVVGNGDAKKVLAESAKKVVSTYFVPFVAHATMEPMNCTAWVQKDRCDVWAPTQAQTMTHQTAMKLTGLPADKVFVHTTLLGCGFGRRARPDFVIDAVTASKAAGKPVKVIWSREEDLQYDPFRSATCQRLEAGLDAQGRLTAWSQKVSCASILKFSNPAGIKNGIDIYSLWGIYDWDVTPVFNRTVYELPNWHLEQVLSDLPIPVSPWRSVQNAPNAFVMESFMDELAHAAGRDPVAFRMDLLKNNMRARRVLEVVAEKGNWGRATPQGQGRGISQHSCFGSYLAMVADVSVGEKDGRVRVHKITAAIDCGPIVNPGPLVAQVEGAAIMGVSTALKEQIEFANGGVKTANFGDYRLLRMSEVPEIEVHIVKSTEKIGGVGEPGVPPVAPAIANAVFNLTRARVRRMPLTPQNVMGAVKNL